MDFASSATMDHNFQKNFWIKEGEFYFVENYYFVKGEIDHIYCI